MGGLPKAFVLLRHSKLNLNREESSQLALQDAKRLVALIQRNLRIMQLCLKQERQS